MDVAAGKTLEAEIQDSKPLSIISNGVLKRHHHTAFNNYQDGGCTGGGVVVYKECLKNHAASLGAHAVDGCGEFMPSPASNPADPTSLKCAACGCHRNFHRQESDDALTSTVPSSNSTLAIEYQPHHRHHPPPPPPPPPPPAPAGSHSSPSSESPPPISSSYYPSAPHLLLTLSGGIAAAAATHQDHLTPPGGSRSAPVVSHSNGRKRFRTRFTQDQKGKMLEFAEKLDWKMQKKDEGLITGFCNEVGVEKGVFKVWMHNNKNYPGGGGGGKSSSIPIPSTINTNSCSATTYNGNNNGVEIAQQNHDKDINDHFQEQNRHQHDDSFSGRVVAPYGSSTSS